VSVVTSRPLFALILLYLFALYSLTGCGGNPRYNSEFHVRGQVVFENGRGASDILVRIGESDLLLSEYGPGLNEMKNTYTDDLGHYEIENIRGELIPGGEGTYEGIGPFLVAAIGPAGSDTVSVVLHYGQTVVAEDLVLPDVED